jgi:nucleotide-binding universal stress UspA family protein
MSKDTGNHLTIVVGIDGSEASMGALRWGVRLAELTGASVRVVVAWHWPRQYGASAPAAYNPADHAQRLVEEILESLGKDHPDVHVDSTVSEGSAAPVLIEASKGANLLVVGSRGHGEFAGMLLGSVSQHCVSHAPCPVVVMRGDYDQLLGITQ